MQDEELKSCPYCNSTAIKPWEDEDGDVLYCCGSCGLCGPWGENAIEAKQKWNSLLRQSDIEQLEHNRMELKQLRAEYIVLLVFMIIVIALVVGTVLFF